MHLPSLKISGVLFRRFSSKNSGLFTFYFLFSKFMKKNIIFQHRILDGTFFEILNFKLEKNCCQKIDEHSFKKYMRKAGSIEKKSFFENIFNNSITFQGPKVSFGNRGGKNRKFLLGSLNPNFPFKGFRLQSLKKLCTLL